MFKSDQIYFLLQCNLQGIKKTESGYNFSCPICGDSKKNQSKRRCWALTRKDPNDLLIFCHNCGWSSKIKLFLEKVNKYLYNEYVAKEKEDNLTKAKQGCSPKKQTALNNFININIPIKYKFRLNQKYFKPAKNYKEAIEFCTKRKILDRMDSLFYCVHPNSPASGMIIFPCYMEDGETLYAFLGRHTKFKKFHIFSHNESFKIFNIFNVKLDEDVYVFESIIDSYLIENSVAVLGADVSVNVLERIKKPVFVFDNDSTGRKKILKYYKLDKEGKKYNFFIPPDNFHYKDFNEAYCAGWTKEKLGRLLKDNIYTGIAAYSKIVFKLKGKQ